MIVVTKSKSCLLGMLFFLIFPLVNAIADSSITTSCSNKSEDEHPAQQCHSYSEKISKNKPKLALFINAANGNINWERVNHLADSSKWKTQELVLDNFGTIMRDDSFTAALENSYHTMKETLEDIQPDILLASSKGIGVIAYLASKNLWVKHPVILFSPIPNPIDGLVDGSSYELEWSDTIDIMRRHRLGPILVVAGSSIDEEMLISQAMQEPSECGEVSRKTGTFENCRDWRHVVVAGDHEWIHLSKNEGVISNLIDYMFLWLEKNNDEKER
mmetsp:Transcript_41696/g.73276  ORF Transcript_41696/g.73276 Transcript_41696/m.73276 type:complete len:273 (-) Transcript_41696:1-819(-)